MQRSCKSYIVENRFASYMMEHLENHPPAVSLKLVVEPRLFLFWKSEGESPDTFVFVYELDTEFACFVEIRVDLLLPAFAEGEEAT